MRRWLCASHLDMYDVIRQAVVHVMLLNSNLLCGCALPYCRGRQTVSTCAEE